MENQPEASNMIMMFERMLQEQRSTKMGQWLASEKKEGFGTDSETEIRFGRPSTEGSRDYDREGNRRNYGGATTEGDGESEDRDCEEVGRPSRKLQVYGPTVHMVR